MVRSSTYEAHYSSSALRDGSPVLVVHIHKAGETEEVPHADKLPPPQEPMVVVYLQPTFAQSWRVIQQGCVMLLRHLRSASARYLKRCNLAYERLKGIDTNRKSGQ